jgi:tetratricopeptide (TPR) repeat protein
MRALGFLLVAFSLSASPEAVRRADALYHRTLYEASLEILARDPTPDAATYALTGKNYFMLGDYKKAIEIFERAVALAPPKSDYQLWLGRAYGKRAETGGWLAAGIHASKARQCFETAVALDPHNRDAMNDLFDYYLNAPGFLGGGSDKAESLAKRIEHERPAEYHYEMAQLAERKKQYAAAEQHLRSAMSLAPGDVGRLLDLARYLSKHGRIEESDALFLDAGRLRPNEPRVVFARAETYIETRRHSEEARRLLRQYIASDRTPDDPPQQAAEKLLYQIQGD